MKTRLPEKMRAVELRAWDGPLAVVERPLPKPGAGEVLVKIAASPINPSDLMFLKGKYVRKPLPVVPGFEAAGRVMASGGGLAARALVGRRVSCSAPDRGDGTWAEYLVTPASRCFPLRPKISDEAGASMLVNPLTAWTLLAMARREKHRAAAQTAAASALGRMMTRLALRYKVPMVHIVRRPEQAELLRGLGAEHIVDSSRPDFDGALKESFTRLGVSIVFDAVAGDLTAALLRALQSDGRVVVYGALSEAPSTIDPSALIFGSRRIDGFWLPDWFRRAPPVEKVRAGLAVQQHLLGDLKTKIRARFPLAEIDAALAQYAANMTAGKVLIVP